MKKRFLSGMICVALLMTMMLTGCAQNTGNTSSNGNSVNTGTSETDNSNNASGREKVFKIGLVTAFSGNSAAQGQDMLDATMLYLKQHDNKIGDWTIEVISEDDENNATTTLTKARKLVEMDGVNIIMGPSGTAGAFALLDYAKESEIPVYMPAAGGDDITQRQRNDYVVRTASSSSQPMLVLGEYCATELGYKRAAVIANDFQFGYDVAGGFHKAFEDNGGEVVYRVFVPGDVSDFSPYISQLPLDDIDVLFWNFSTSQAVRFATQLSEYGVYDQVDVVAGSTGCDETALPQMGDWIVGMVSAQNYSAVLDNPNNTAFVEAFEEEYGRAPSMASEQFYTGMLFLAAAIETAEDPTDPQQLLEAIRTVKVDNAPRGPISVDEYGNAVHNIYIRKVEKVNGELQNTVIKTYENVSQFYNYDPEEWLASPSFSKDYPPLNSGNQ